FRFDDSRSQTSASPPIRSTRQEFRSLPAVFVQSCWCLYERSCLETRKDVEWLIGAELSGVEIRSGDVKRASRLFARIKRVQPKKRDETRRGKDWCMTPEL